MMKVIVFLVIIFTSLSFAQFEEDKDRSSPSSFSPITFEAIPYWNEDTTSVDLIILYRINPSFLYFAKKNANQNDIYEAKGELIFEIFDEKDEAIARKLCPLRIERNSLPSEGEPFPDGIQGSLSFKLKKGIYKIVVDAKDNESGISSINRDFKVNANLSFSSGIHISPFIFVEPISMNSSSPSTNTFYPVNFGGDIVIGQSGGCLFQIYTPDTSSNLNCTWKLKGNNNDDEDSSKEFIGNQFLQMNDIPSVIENQGRVSYSTKPSSKQYRLIYIPFPTKRLKTGSYSFNVILSQDSLKTNKDFHFRIIWPRKPHSLSNFKLSVEALKHIATEEELNSITAFSSSKSMKAFNAFWSKRNPDTTSAFNPAMAEYYRRVDETIKRFSSANELDGYRTDRGRIFILFGSPSFTNRLLKPNSAPTEIWTYEKLSRRFVFTDQRKTGNFILIKMENY